MQKNLFLIIILLSATISEHLVRARSCLPCALAANSLRNLDGNSLDDKPILSMEWAGEDLRDPDYYLVLEKLRQRSRSARKLDAILNARTNPISRNGNVTPLPPVQKQRHYKRYVSCQFATLPIRHARAAEAREDARQKQNTKKRAAVPDLTLCHFKICNMGRKRN